MYLLDTNVFIQAHKTYYAFDICPGFWDCLIHFCDLERLVSIEKVRDMELIGDDALAQWARQAPDRLFLPSTAEPVAKAYSEIMQWVYRNDQFRPAAKASFAAKADGWLVAMAIVHRYDLVTQEPEDNACRKRVPIPNVCRAFGVQWHDTYAMLRALRARFGWSHDVKRARHEADAL